VHNAAQTLDFLEKNSVDVILLDWILPDRDGVALLQHLRDRGFTLPIIMLSGETALQGKVRALNRGADDYLAKPVETDELIARVHALARRSSGMFQPPRAGRITLDPWTHQARIGEDRIDLTPFEYAILAHLMRHVDEIVSQKELVDAVWGEKGVDGSTKALHIQLTRLRRKLGSAAEQIETVRGAGVRLSSNYRAAV